MYMNWQSSQVRIFDRLAMVLPFKLCFPSKQWSSVLEFRSKSLRGKCYVVMESVKLDCLESCMKDVEAL